MKSIPALSLVLLLALPLTAQVPPAPPRIDALLPAAGTSEGGTIVTITGDRLTLPSDFACLVPCPAKVRFGSSETTVLTEEDERLTVRTPFHPAGTVDVTVVTGDGRSTTATNAFTFVADTEPGYTALLLPVYFDGIVTGDRGSQWKSEFWIRNNGATPVVLAPWTCDNAPCPPVFPLTRALAPSETMKDLPAFFRPPTTNIGRILHVSAAAAHNLSTSLRIRDLSRAELDPGAEVPVLGEEEMLTTTANLMSIPLHDNARLMLRIYDTAQKESQFRVRIFAQAEGVVANPPLLKEITLTATSTDEGPFRLQPAYAQFSDFAGLQATDVTSLVRIEVEPRTAGSVFWAFVSVTNNDTQRLTLVTP